MTIEIKNRMYRNIALLVFLLLTSLVAAFANETDTVVLSNDKAQISCDQPSQSISMIKR